MYKGKIPFAGPKARYSKPGSLIEFVDYGKVEPKDTEEIVWRENGEFDAHLRLSGYEKGRSSVRFVFRDREDREFSMSLDDFYHMMEKTHLRVNIYIDARWVFAKKGTNYGIQCVKVYPAGVVAA